MNATAARLFFGQVMHRRLRPAANRFVYPVYFCLLPLSGVSQSARVARSRATVVGSPGT